MTLASTIKQSVYDANVYVIKQSVYDANVYH